MKVILLWNCTRFLLICAPEIGTWLSIGFHISFVWTVLKDSSTFPVQRPVTGQREGLASVAALLLFCKLLILFLFCFWPVGELTWRWFPLFHNMELGKQNLNLWVIILLCEGLKFLFHSQTDFNLQSLCKNQQHTEECSSLIKNFVP